MSEIEFILYVENQNLSRDFYASLFDLVPILDVPGMTEFQLSQSVKLGLMPNDGMAKILGNKTPHPSTGSGIPRCELYLKILNALAYLERGVQLGGIEISPMKNRDWGDYVGYLADLDGHVLAFAEKK